MRVFGSISDGRHDTAVDQQHPPVARLQRRQHVIDRRAVGAAGIDIGFFAVDEPAVENNTVIVRGGAFRQCLVERPWRGSEIAVRLRDQTELPLQPFELPNAQADEKGEQHRAERGERREGRKWSMQSATMFPPPFTGEVPSIARRRGDCIYPPPPSASHIRARQPPPP